MEMHGMGYTRIGRETTQYKDITRKSKSELEGHDVIIRKETNLDKDENGI